MRKASVSGDNLGLPILLYYFSNHGDISHSVNFIIWATMSCIWTG